MTDRRAEILPLRATGKSYLEIAKALGIGRDVVAGIVRRSKEAPGEAKAKRRGHPQKKGPRDTARAAEAVRLFQEGLSYRAIALQLGMSRNAVAGVVTRAGVLRKNKAPPAPSPEPTHAPPTFEPGGDIPAYRWAAIMAIGPGQCRFSFGDPRKRNFHFCCKPTRPGKSWCPTHYAVVFPPRLRQRPPSDFVEPVVGKHYRVERFGATR